jgi:hypothetical protein
LLRLLLSVELIQVAGIGVRAGSDRRPDGGPPRSGRRRGGGLL